jgi:glucose/arabinose dehydrogenase
LTDALLALALLLASAAAGALPLEQLKLPPGFAIEVWARADNVRGLALGEHTVFAGSSRAGKVYAIPFDQALKAGSTRLIAEGLRMPVGVAYREGRLYASAIDRILVWGDIEAKLDAPGDPAVFVEGFPSEIHHGWKYIAFGPDGWLYVPVGAPCNICEPDPQRFAALFRVSPDGQRTELLARGIRNTVGFDWQPGSGALWFTDNGRDWLGDDRPPDELNVLTAAGSHFGYPYCHGGAIADPEYGHRAPCSAFVPPAQALDAHVAPLGIRFYTGKQFPAAYRDQAFVADHGSWNRSSKAGYRVMLARIEGQRVISYTPFVTGWLQDGAAWGRPAAMLTLPDGSMLLSDDLSGTIYRISYTPPA